MKQIFLNLILNSIDAINLNPSNKPRNIHIKIDVKQDNSIIEIVDTGIGIPKDEIHKIFDPFYTTKDNGTGIGLPIIHNIITSSSGKIKAESREKHSTKITLLLPLA